MSNVQLQGLLKARNELTRARKEYDRAKLHETAYRGVVYSNESTPTETHGSYTYRGNSYIK